MCQPSRRPSSALVIIFSRIALYGSTFGTAKGLKDRSLLVAFTSIACSHPTRAPRLCVGAARGSPPPAGAPSAPRLVSSLARPTRPEWAVTRRSMPAALAAAVNRSPIICGESGTTRPSGAGAAAARSARTARAGAVLQVADIIRLAVLVRLAAADGDEDAISVAGVGHVDPAQRGDFRPLQPAHEEQPGDHRVETPPRGGHPLRLDAAAAPARPVARGEHGRQVRGAEWAGLAAATVGGRPAVAGEYPGGPLAGRVRLAGELRAEAGRGHRIDANALRTALVSELAAERERRLACGPSLNPEGA